MKSKGAVMENDQNLEKNKQKLATKIAELTVIKQDLLDIANHNAGASDIFEKILNFKVKWYHCLYDSDLRELKREYNSSFENYRRYLARLQRQIKLQEQSELDRAGATTKLSMLSVSGHLYAEGGKLLLAQKRNAFAFFVMFLNVLFATGVIYSIIFS